MIINPANIGGSLTSPILQADGAIGAPSYSFTSSPNSGLSILAGTPSLVGLGVTALQWNANELFASLPYEVVNQRLTAGTLTAPTAKRAILTTVLSRYDWTNAMIVALGAVSSGNLLVATLPAKTVVKNAYIILTGAATGPTTLTVSLGRTGATFLDYLAAKDAKAAANTVYGAVAGDRGTNLTGFDLPSSTGTTAVNIQFVATVTTLDTTLASSGSVFLETMILP